jgi:hypothetical protein
MAFSISLFAIDDNIAISFMHNICQSLKMLLWLVSGLNLQETILILYTLIQSVFVGIEHAWQPAGRRRILNGIKAWLRPALAYPPASDFDHTEHPRQALDNQTQAESIQPFQRAA